MLYFSNDYSEGAHIKILNRLIETNYISQPGYGDDCFSKSAKEKIKAACACPDADIWFLTGGTQTNQIVIDSMLRQNEGVIAAVSGHVNSHEAGAIEFTGHKVLTLPQNDGKITPDALLDYLKTYHADGNREHMVYPGMVYISHPTEYGTLYNKEELTRLSEICGEFNIPLYLDGARLGYALACPENDLSLEDIAKLCGVFYIGGTKVGALCGEAVVFTKNNTPPHFTSIIKQHGALLAKGRLLGLQFDTLFTDGLYLEISKNAIETAEILRQSLREKGYRFYIESPTNQLFIILDNKKLEELKENVAFSFWEKYDDGHTVVRFATSWATSRDDVMKLTELL